MPLGGPHPTVLLQYLLSASHFRRDSLCHPARPCLSGTRVSSLPIRSGIQSSRKSSRAQGGSSGIPRESDAGRKNCPFSFCPEECHGLVDKEPFRLRCLEAVCSCDPGRDCLCPVLSAYARHCAQEGVLLQWRNDTLCREFLCPVNPNLGPSPPPSQYPATIIRRSWSGQELLSYQTVARLFSPVEVQGLEVQTRWPCF